jgi:hypothetical protein
MEKKVEAVTKEGRIIRVMPHMLNDLARFDVTFKKPAIRDTPKELLDIPAKTIISKPLISFESNQEPKKPGRQKLVK